MLHLDAEDIAIDVAISTRDIARAWWNYAGTRIPIVPGHELVRIDTPDGKAFHVAIIVTPLAARKDTK